MIKNRLVKLEKAIDLKNTSDENKIGEYLQGLTEKELRKIIENCEILENTDKVKYKHKFDEISSMSEAEFTSRFSKSDIREFLDNRQIDNARLY